MFQAIKEIAKETNKPRFIIFLDVVWCGLHYGAGYIDYKLFKMYNLNHHQRTTVLTRVKNNKIVKKYNDQQKSLLFDDKVLFNDKFKEYLHRDYIDLTKTSLKGFQEFISKHKEIIVKPVLASCGKGIEKINTTKEIPSKLYNRLKQNQQTLVEEVIIQDKEMSSLYPKAVNDIRVVTLNHEIVATYLRIGNGDAVVDNFNHGGLLVPISDDGTIKMPAVNKNNEIFEKHPVTNKDIIGFKIPYWQEVLKLVKDASYVCNEVLYVGWDIGISTKGPVIIEGNPYPGHDIFSMPIHTPDGIGIYPKLKEVMKKH